MKLLTRHALPVDDALRRQSGRLCYAALTVSASPLEYVGTGGCARVSVDPILTETTSGFTALRAGGRTFIRSNSGHLRIAVGCGRGGGITAGGKQEDGGQDSAHSFLSGSGSHLTYTDAASGESYTRGQFVTSGGTDAAA